jgi:hypothetical protein
MLRLPNSTAPPRRIRPLSEITTPETKIMLTISITYIHLFLAEPEKGGGPKSNNTHSQKAAVPIRYAKEMKRKEEAAAQHPKTLVPKGFLPRVF